MFSGCAKGDRWTEVGTDWQRLDRGMTARPMNEGWTESKAGPMGEERTYGLGLDR